MEIFRDMQEFNFDKFMDDMEKRELQEKLRREEQQRDEDASPRKDLQRRYQETTANRIRYSK